MINETEKEKKRRGARRESQLLYLSTKAVGVRKGGGSFLYYVRNEKRLQIEADERERERESIKADRRVYRPSIERQHQ